MIVVGVLMLLVIAPLAMFWAAGRVVVVGVACCLAAVALWRAATLQARVRTVLGRPSSAADVIHVLCGWLAQRRRDPIVSRSALDRGWEYAAGVQDGAYATLDEMMDRLAELLRMLPDEQRRSPLTPPDHDRPGHADRPPQLQPTSAQPHPAQPHPAQPHPARPESAGHRGRLRLRGRRKPATPGGPAGSAGPAGSGGPAGSAGPTGSGGPAGSAGPTSQAAPSVLRPAPPAARRPADAEILPIRTF